MHARGAGQGIRLLAKFPDVWIFRRTKILTRPLPSSASCQSRVWIFFRMASSAEPCLDVFSQNPASSSVRIFRPGQCQDFSQHRACSEMHLQSNFMGFCMILAWLRSCVRIFFRMASWAELCQDFIFAWPAGLSCVRIFFAWASWPELCQDFFSRCEIKILTPRKINFLTPDALLQCLHTPNRNSPHRHLRHRACHL